MLTATVKVEVPAWKQPPPPGAWIPELPEDTKGRNMDFKEYLATFRNSGKQTVDPSAFRDEKLGYVVLQEIEKVPEIWQNNKISRRNNSWATVGAATFNRTGSIVNMPTMAKIFHRGRTLLRDRIQRKIAAAKKAKQVIWDEDLERYLWTFPEHFALRFFREKLQKHITNCRTKDCFDASGEPIVFTIEDSEEEVEEDDAQEFEENHHPHNFRQNQIGDFDDMVIEENFEYDDQQQHVHQNQDQDFEDVIEERMIYEDDLLVENEVEVREEEIAADNRFNEPAKNVEKFSSPTKPKNLLYHNQLELMQQQAKQQYQPWHHQQEERHQPRRNPMDQDQIESMQQPAQRRHQQEHNLQDERHQARRIPQQWHQPEQNLQEERLHNQAQARQAPPEAQRPPTQRPQNVVFNPEVDIGFISHNLRRIGEEHPERQQLIINVMRAYLEVFNSNLPANTTPEDVYEYLTREYPNETGEQL
ncbi:hypothetical protein L5515_019700 [Caenorhabditis briggsae]|uniref:Uncharacterized protein n=1 Tax=Caenorhabditis briggsae TaxID=6238 RepID=A0AAE9FJV6_CAEBR|nr:hypothetical protein L5515_019700 [Caenorhabditis briggsae]